MKKRIVIGVVVVLVGCLTSPAEAHGRGGFGGFQGGFHGGGGFQGHFGGFQGGFIHPGLHGGFVRPGFPGFGRFGPFQHELVFGPPPHFGPFVPFGHEHHFLHERFLSPHHHFDGFFFGSPFFPVNPRVVVIGSPFFCFPHGLAFTTQALFIEHLHGAHGLPFESALSFCTPVGSRLLFFDSAQRDFLVGSPFVPTGPPAFAPAGPPAAEMNSPFFCAPHGLGFIDQALFLDHLRRVHGIPLSRALSCCTVEGARVIFAGF